MFFVLEDPGEQVRPYRDTPLNAFKRALSHFLHFPATNCHGAKETALMLFWTVGERLRPFPNQRTSVPGSIVQINLDQLIKNDYHDSGSRVSSRIILLLVS